MFFKSIFTIGLGLTFGSSLFAQGKIYTQPQNGGDAFEIPLGATEIQASSANIQSIELEPGTVVVLYEKYLNGKTAGRHKLVTASDPAFQPGFKVMYAIAFQNPENKILGFEEPNFAGKTVAFEPGRNEVPEDFGLSSIYIPKGAKVKLYMIDPQTYPDQEVEHRPMGAGIRPFIGGDIDNKVRFVVVE